MRASRCVFTSVRDPTYRPVIQAFSCAAPLEPEVVPRHKKKRVRAEGEVCVYVCVCVCVCVCVRGRLLDGERRTVGEYS